MGKKKLNLEILDKQFLFESSGQTSQSMPQQEERQLEEPGQPDASPRGFHGALASCGAWIGAPLMGLLAP